MTTLTTMTMLNLSFSKYTAPLEHFKEQFYLLLGWVLFSSSMSRTNISVKT